MNLINLTPHAINVVNSVGDSIAVYPPSGSVARVNQKDVSTGLYLNGSPVICALFGHTEGLPEPEPNTFYICSFIVCQANRPNGSLIKGGCYDYDPHGGNEAAIMTAKQQLNSQGGGVIFLVECWETSERKDARKYRVKSSNILSTLNKTTDSWNYKH